MQFKKDEAKAESRPNLAESETGKRHTAEYGKYAKGFAMTALAHLFSDFGHSAFGFGQTASQIQPTRKLTPPKGVIAPSQRIFVNANA
jgi:hypothetical protein